MFTLVCKATVAPVCVVRFPPSLPFHEQAARTGAFTAQALHRRLVNYFPLVYLRVVGRSSRLLDSRTCLQFSFFVLENRSGHPISPHSWSASRSHTCFIFTYFISCLPPACPQTPLYRKPSGYKDPSGAAASFKPAAAHANAYPEAASWDPSVDEKSARLQREEQERRRQASLDLGAEGSAARAAGALGKEAADNPPVDVDSASLPQIVGAPEPASGAHRGSSKLAADGVEVDSVAGAGATVPVNVGGEGTNGVPPAAGNLLSAGGAGGAGSAGKGPSPKEGSSERSSVSPSVLPAATTTKPIEANGTVSLPVPVRQSVVEKKEPNPKSGSALMKTPAASASASAATARATPQVETGATSTAVARWQKSSPTSTPSASRARESGAKSPNTKAKAAVSPKKGGTGSSGTGSSSSSSRKGGDASKRAKTEAAKEKKEPKIKVPRPELLGAVVARLAVRRDLPDEEYTEIDGGFLWDEDDGSCGDDMSESDGEEEEEEEEEEADERQGRGSNAEAKKERRRRRRRSKRRGGEATVVREAVVSSFDGVEGRYVLINTHDEEETLSLQELEVALRQSQVWVGVCPPPPHPPALPPPRATHFFLSFDILICFGPERTEGVSLCTVRPPLPHPRHLHGCNPPLLRISLRVPRQNALRAQLLYGCAERMLPLSPSELEQVRAGELEAPALVNPPAEDAALAGTGAGGSGGGFGTSGETLDSKSLDLVSLLRRKSYAVFTPAERTRLLRGLCDLAVSTGPIKEHLQVIVSLFSYVLEIAYRKSGKIVAPWSHTCWGHDKTHTLTHTAAAAAAGEKVQIPKRYNLLCVNGVIWLSALPNLNVPS